MKTHLTMDHLFADISRKIIRDGQCGEEPAKSQECRCPYCDKKLTGEIPAVKHLGKLVAKIFLSVCVWDK